MSLGTYKQVQFGDLANRLSARLGDPVPSNGPALGFWTAPEIRGYLIEALRTWQAHSAFFSTRATFPTGPQLFYETTSLIPQLSFSVTDRNIIQDIAWALQEPFTDGSLWTGTQFTLDAITTAIQQRRDRFKVESGIGSSVDELVYSGGPGGVFELPDNIIDVRRVMWKNSSGVYSILWKADQFSLSAGSPSWFNNPGTPTDYSLVLQQPLALQLSPPPNDVGSIHLISLHSGVQLNPLTRATILNIPDDLAWVVKFGALADLFGEDGIGKDPARAEYCEERWRDGIKLARIYNSVRFGYIDGVPTFLDALEELDQSNPLWVSSPASKTTSYLAIRGSILAAFPRTNSQPNSIALDITPKFPIPTDDLDWIQLGQEYLDVILDYAEHLANVKVGAEELKDTYRCYQNFVSQASLINDRLMAQAGNFDVLSDRSRISDHLNPRRKSDIGQAKQL